MDPRTAQVAAVAALAEPTRRRLYDHVVRQPEPVGRDEVAGALDVPRATVAFHLDRLVADGLLAVHYERRTGRSGPGAGRPAKLYRRAECSVSVSLPERRYDLAGELLAAALTEAEESGERPAAVLDRLAHARGREFAAAVDGAGGREAVLRVLEEHGYEPQRAGESVTLRNCPFHTLARTHTELVCGMNLRLLEGVLAGVGAGGLTARLRPGAGACCVQLDGGDRDPGGGARDR
ncbi:Predicted transcriptional regulator, ArsR family [Geodermatophilus saharensis]|uniref:Predicted transcriptional regulator, ArsR family n=1 Tax=Geodermatophilus saharensis TaxID=1137994 RepID=A0A239BNY4_9ACTN|nr:helix-turn-helix domain-containing protein [Geodermatophilus saharensis]SNS08754.1 Predicted transcriptional regulator, ArsR family [Geodermatophilus saharensis]